MDDVEFKESVRQGVILRFKVDRIKLGNTSVTYQVEVNDVSEGKQPSTIFKTNVTFVALSEEGEDGRPRAIDRSAG